MSQPDRFGRRPLGPRPPGVDSWRASLHDEVVSGETESGMYGVSACRRCGRQGRFTQGWRLWQHAPDCVNRGGIRADPNHEVDDVDREFYLDTIGG